MRRQAILFFLLCSVLLAGHNPDFIEKASGWHTFVDTSKFPAGTCSIEFFNLKKKVSQKDNKDHLIKSFIDFRLCIKKASQHAIEKLSFRILSQKLSPPTLKPRNFELRLNLLARDLKNVEKAIRSNQIDYGIKLLKNTELNLIKLENDSPRRSGGKIVDYAEN
jgi:hypothetical protein